MRREIKYFLSVKKIFKLHSQISKYSTQLANTLSSTLSSMIIIIVAIFNAVCIWHCHSVISLCWWHPNTRSSMLFSMTITIAAIFNALRIWHCHSIISLCSSETSLDETQIEMRIIATTLLIAERNPISCHERKTKSQLPKLKP